MEFQPPRRNIEREYSSTNNIYYFYDSRNCNISLLSPFHNFLKNKVKIKFKLLFFLKLIRVETQNLFIKKYSLSLYLSTTRLKPLRCVKLKEYFKYIYFCFSYIFLTIAKIWLSKSKHIFLFCVF